MSKGCRNRTHRFLGDESAVSVMVGALLLVGIVVATMVTVRVTYVPVWEEDREATQARAVEQQFARIKADLDRLTDNATDVPVSDEVNLGSRSTGVFRLPTLPNSLQFIADSTYYNVSSTAMRIHSENGTDYTRLNETYNAIVPGTQVLDLSSVRSFRLRIAQLSSASIGGSVTVQITDGNGANAGIFRANVEDSGGGYLVNIAVTDQWGTTLFSGAQHFDDSVTRTPYWIDPLDDEYRFDQVLGAALAPYDLVMSDSIIEASYTLTYAQTGTTGTLVRADGGLLAAPYYANHSGGRLEYTAQNRYYVAHGLALEHGAILLEQTDGVVMRAPPQTEVGLVANVVTLELVVPEPTGEGASIAGNSALSIFASSQDRHTLAAEARDLTVNLTTAYPAPWAAHWTSTLTALGLSESSGHFTVTTGTEHVTVTINGISADPNAYDIYLDLRQGDVALTVAG